MAIKIPKDLVVEDWDSRFIGKRIYRLTPQDKYITQTGSAVNTDFTIPKPHRLVKVELKHTDSADADSTDALTWELDRRLWELLIPLVKYSSSTNTNFVEKFGEGYEFEGGGYRLVTNTTNTDRIYVAIYVQLLED